jgi:NADPH2:quinone reductase
VRAIVAGSLGGPEVLTLRDVPDPEPGPGRLSVRVEAIGVNYRDIYERTGTGGYNRKPPFTPGTEGAGTIIKTGPGVPGEFAPGQRVAWTDGPASYAEQALVPASRAVPVPGGVDARLAAAVLLQGMTAHYLCYSTFPVKEGDVAVVHAAAGGVGLLLTQLVKKRGGIVVATTSPREKAELAQRAGADHITTYDEFAEAVKRLTGERGADVVFDGVGKDTFDAGLDALRPRGMMALYGGASGQVPPLNPQRLNSGGSLYLTRPNLRDYTADRAELLWRAGDLLEYIAKGELDVRIGAEYPLGEAARAHEDLAARRTSGKLLLIP